jgi:hypothetical protein
MRKIVMIIFILIQSVNTFGQDNLNLSENWNELKQLLEYRSDIGLEIVSKLEKSKKIDLSELQKAKESAQVLKLISKNQVFDKLNVDLTHEKNTELTKHLTRTLVNLEFDQKLKKKEEIQSLLHQLIVLEQQICISVHKFNEICRHSKSEELEFILDCDNESPKVEFD